MLSNFATAYILNAMQACWVSIPPISYPGCVSVIINCAGAQMPVTNYARHFLVEFSGISVQKTMLTHG